MRPLSKDLQEFILLLNEKKVRYVVVGAWALAYHGRPRYTGDIDIFLECDPHNADRLIDVIRAFGFGDTGISKEDFLKKDFVIQLGVEPNRIDLLTGISGVDFARAWDQVEKGDICGIQVNFLSRDLLIQNKRASNRDKDLGDIRLLEKTRPSNSHGS